MCPCFCERDTHKEHNTIFTQRSLNLMQPKKQVERRTNAKYHLKLVFLSKCVKHNIVGFNGRRGNKKTKKSKSKTVFSRKREFQMNEYRRVLIFRFLFRNFPKDFIRFVININ